MIGSAVGFLRDVRRSWRRVCEDAAIIGLPGAVQLAAIRRRGRRRQSGLWEVHVRGWHRPIRGRYGSSDLATFRQIFIEREHAPVVPLLRHGPGAGMLILDCGANVGYASIFFLMHCPAATIVAIEPDDENFEMLETNVGGLDRRVELVHAGLWSHETLLGCGNLGFRDGQHWGRQVYEAAPGSGQSRPAVTVPGLLAASGFDRLSLLKMDIEGAEAVVFSTDCSQWLERTDAIAIELHDDSMFGSGSDAFRKATVGQGFRFTTSGELTIACRGPGG